MNVDQVSIVDFCLKTRTTSKKKTGGEGEGVKKNNKGQRLSAFRERAYGSEGKYVERGKKKKIHRTSSVNPFG